MAGADTKCGWDAEMGERHMAGVVRKGFTGKEGLQVALGGR